MALNDCCDLPGDQHRCHDKACKKKVYLSLEEVKAHIAGKKHHDPVHAPTEKAARRASSGVQRAVEAEKAGNVSSSDESDSSDRKKRVRVGSSMTVVRRSRQVNNGRSATTKMAAISSLGSSSSSTQVEAVSGTLSSAEEEEIETSDVIEVPKERIVDRLILQSKEKQNVRRGSGKQNRGKTSLWTRYGASSTTEESGKVIADCFVCGARVSLNANGSSSNLRSHFQTQHKFFLRKLRMRVSPSRIPKP